MDSELYSIYIEEFLKDRGYYCAMQKQSTLENDAMNLKEVTLYEQREEVCMAILPDEFNIYGLLDHDLGLW